jgi:hypothetical protein
MVKVFTPNKNGKIEFTKKELENLLNEVWRDGYNSNTNYTWHSPWWYGGTYYGVSCTDSTSSASTVTIPSSDNITLTSDHATLSSDNITNNSITIKTGE